MAEGKGKKISQLKKALEEHDKEIKEEEYNWREIKLEFGVEIVVPAYPKHLQRKATIDSEFIKKIRKIIS
ncbi:MAG: hypothetical protein HYW71_03205 [Candidatus Niyogibacteria bacterium]|nr:hypothetical protein [Candidatus Niyogibacteria bacterium]